MKQCAYCGKQPLPKGQRKYCNDTCKQRYAVEGQARERFVYKQVEPENVNVELLNAGAWMLVRKSQSDEECIGDFMRTWKRAPEHVIYDPKTPMWKFVGPIWTQEELDHRWKVGQR